MKIVTDSLGNQEITGDHCGDGFVGNGRIGANQQACTGWRVKGDGFVGAARRASAPIAVLTYRGGNMRFTGATKDEALGKARTWAAQKRIPRPYTINGGPAFVGIAGCCTTKVPGTGPRTSSSGAFTKLA